MDQVLNLLGCFICRGRPPQNSHNNQHKMFQSHCKEYFNAFVTPGCSSGKKFLKLLWGLIIFLCLALYWQYKPGQETMDGLWENKEKFHFFFLTVQFLTVVFLKDHDCNFYTNWNTGNKGSSVTRHFPFWYPLIVSVTFFLVLTTTLLSFYQLFL